LAGLWIRHEACHNSSAMPAPTSNATAQLSGLPGMLASLPLALLYPIADTLCFVSYRIFGFQRNLTEQNVSGAFPDLDAARVARLARCSARNAVHVMVETLRAGRLRREELARRVSIDNPDLIEQLAADYGSVIALAAHHGNWEWLQLACAARLALPVAALYKPIGRKRLDALLRRLRSRFGSLMIPARTALPELVSFARRQGVIALVADQGPRPDEEKYWGRLLGRDTAFFTGPEKLARVLRAPLVFAHMQRLKRGHYRVRFETLAVPPYVQAEGALLERYIDCLEKQILEAPQDWLWSYKRWKYARPLYAP
jgi:KDO2-lipid IV(A) lauroyltransferase